MATILSRPQCVKNSPRVTKRNNHVVSIDDSFFSKYSVEQDQNVFKPIIEQRTMMDRGTLFYNPTNAWCYEMKLRLFLFLCIIHYIATVHLNMILYIQFIPHTDKIGLCCNKV